jgi:hypothetical protein
MKKNVFLLLGWILFFFSGCIESSYFFSPSNATSVPYHAVPMKSDSLRAATYVSSTFTVGGANEGWRDGVYAFQGRIHRSHNLGNFQAYYGANISLGSYHVANYYSSSSPSDSTTYSSNNFFGSYGFSGGLNVVLPTNNGNEWRPIGIETSVQKEFGRYYNFRKNLPDSNADVVFRKNITATLGVFTDIIGKSRHGGEFGYKMGLGFMINPSSDYTHVYNRNTVNPVAYFSNTIHFSKSNISGFVQVNLSNSYAGNVQFGVNYRLGKK